MHLTSLFKTVIIASDHAGVNFKSTVVKYLEESKDFFAIDSIIDCGSFNPNVRVDYPNYAKLVVESIQNETTCGILICARGIGMSIAANRFKHIRAALCGDIRASFFSKLHSNANVLVMAAESELPKETTQEMIKTFLTTKFAHGRYQQRLDMISEF